MGETAAQTLSEIEAARAALRNDVELLESRLPPQATMVRGLAAGGAGLTLLGVVGAVLSRIMARRREDRALEREAAIQARAIAAAFAAQHETAHERAVADDGDDDQGGIGAAVAALMALLAVVAAALAWLRRRTQDDVADSPE